jgi:hypothetical protein
MEKLRKFMGLPPVERRLLMKAWLLLLAVRLGLWVLPFRRQRRFWRDLTAVPPGVPPVVDAVDRIAWAVPLAGHYVPGDTCLTQALAVQILLKREGIAAQLQVGVAKDEQGRVTAHAWLEQDGRVLIGDQGLDRLTLLRTLIT